MNIFSSSVPNNVNDPDFIALDARFAVLAQSASGALAAQEAFLPITKAGVAALTLATPVAGLPSAGGNDGHVMTFLDTTGNAHTVTTASNIINGNKHVATFGGTIGQFCSFRAYGGVWYTLANSGITLS